MQNLRLDSAAVRHAGRAYRALLVGRLPSSHQHHDCSRMVAYMVEPYQRREKVTIKTVKCYPGAKFHHWTVIEKVSGKYWSCRCVCGAEEVIQIPWNDHAKKSCGCQKKHWRAQLGETIQPTVPRGSLVHFRKDEKMLCGLEIHRVGGFTQDVSLVTCATCIIRLTKRGMLNGATNITRLEPANAGSSAGLESKRTESDHLHALSQCRITAEQCGTPANQSLSAAV